MKKLFAGLLMCGIMVGVKAQETLKATVLPAGSSVIFELYGSKPENLAKGSIIPLKVLMPVVVNGEKLVTRESYAYAVVTKYHKQGVFGRSELIEITPMGLQARDGQIVSIEGEHMKFKGESRSFLALGISTLIPAAGFATHAKEARLLSAFAMTGLLIKGEEVNKLEQETIQLVGKVSKSIEIGPTILNAKTLMPFPKLSSSK